MTLPAGITTVRVNCGPYLDFRGAVVAGTVTFVPPSSVLHRASGTKLLPRLAPVVLDPVTGLGFIDLPASDDTALEPTNFTYSVVYNFDPTAGKVITPSVIFVPKAAVAVDLENLTDVPQSNGTFISQPAVTMADMGTTVRAQPLNPAGTGYQLPRITHPGTVEWNLPDVDPRVPGGALPGDRWHRRAV